MNLENVKQSLKKVTKKVDDNKSTLLMYGGISGVIGIGLTGISGGMKAKEIIDEADGKITKEVAIDIAKCFVPCGVATVGTILCIFGMRKEYVSQIATLAAIRAADSGSVGNALLKAPEAEVESATEAVRTDSEAANTSKKLKIYDEFNERFIETTVMDLDDARDEVNQEFLAGSGSVEASIFYEHLLDGYCVPESIDGLSWFSEDGILKIEYGSRLDENMKPYLTFRFDRNPESALSHGI